jgi:hypothetical protein
MLHFLIGNQVAGTDSREITIVCDEGTAELQALLRELAADLNAEQRESAA